MQRLQHSVLQSLLISSYSSVTVASMNKKNVLAPKIVPSVKTVSAGKKKLRTVQSGIGISSLDKSATGSLPSAAEQSFLTSRTARVLLAGAGFLADAVCTCVRVLF